jgi:phage FluMu protein Com
MNRCPHCGRRLTAVFGANGRTELQCDRCDEPNPLKSEIGEWESSIVPSLQSKTPEAAGAH